MKSKLKIPKWYHPNLTAREMANKANIAYSYVLSRLKIMGLPYIDLKAEKNAFRLMRDKKTFRLMMDLNRILDILKRIYDENKDKNPEFDKMLQSLEPMLTKSKDDLTVPKWYSSHLSRAEMARRAGLSRERVRQIILRRNLPIPEVPKIPVDIPDWYDPSKTIDEMAKDSNLPKYNVSTFIYRNGLSYQKKPYTSKIRKVYSPDRTIEEMYLLANKEIKPDSIRSTLHHYKLPYKLVNTPRRAESDYLKVYDPNKSLEEMANEMGVDLSTYYRFLRTRGLPYKLVVHKMEEFYQKYYSPEKTVVEMSEESNIPARSIYDFVWKRNLPFKRLKHRK